MLWFGLNDQNVGNNHGKNYNPRKWTVESININYRHLAKRKIIKPYSNVFMNIPKI